MQTDPDSPAFPRPVLLLNADDRTSPGEEPAGIAAGITKREYFAGIALSRLPQHNPIAVAAIAVEQADAIIAALNADPANFTARPAAIAQSDAAGHS